MGGSLGSVASVLWLASCGGGDPREGSPGHSAAGESAADVASPWPVWLYQTSVERRVMELTAVDSRPALRVDGYAWGLMFGGPTLVAEPDQEIRFSVTNQTDRSLTFSWPGVEVVDGAPLLPTRAGANILRTTAGPGISPGIGGEEARLGLFATVAVGDPDQIPLAELDAQLTLSLVDTPPERTEVDACRFDPVPPPECPSWRAALPGETTALVTQRVFVHPGGLRHGGGINEFLTVTASAVELPVGAVVRLHLVSHSDTSHAVGLGGLIAEDPSGGRVDAVDLQPGAATWLLVRGLPAASSLELGCVEHDHRGLGTVRLTVIGP